MEETIYNGNEETIKELGEIISKAASVNYIKLIKNTKGYNWEIKQLSLNLEEMEKLNNEMINKFGGTI